LQVLYRNIRAVSSVFAGNYIRPACGPRSGRYRAGGAGRVIVLAGRGGRPVYYHLVGGDEAARKGRPGPAPPGPLALLGRPEQLHVLLQLHQHGIVLADRGLGLLQAGLDPNDSGLGPGLAPLHTGELPLCSCNSGLDGRPASGARGGRDGSGIVHASIISADSDLSSRIAELFIVHRRKSACASAECPGGEYYQLSRRPGTDRLGRVDCGERWRCVVDVRHGGGVWWTCDMVEVCGGRATWWTCDMVDR